MRKNKSAIFALALLLSPVAFAQEAANKADILRCLSAPVGSANFTWSVQIAQDISQKTDYRLGFEQLKQSLAASNQSRDAIRDAVKKSLGLTVQSFSPLTFLKPGFNISTEMMNLVNQFTAALKPALANIKVPQETSFQIMIAPRLSEELVARRNNSREIPAMTTYPLDRLVIFQELGSVDNAFKSAEDRIATDVFAGIAQYANQAYECKITQPYLVSAQIQVKIMPQVADSQVLGQVILGMPAGLEIPFVQANDQVQFQKIVFPTVSPKALAINNGGLPDASQYPVAIVNISQKLASNAEIPVHIEFGPLGAYYNKKWNRTSQVNDNAMVPKLRGLAAGNLLKRAIAIDFNIFNLSLNLVKQEVTDLDIFLSVGYRRFPNFSFGRINRTDVDTQFLTEINKTIQPQIAAQKDNLKRLTNGNLNPAEQDAVIGAVSKLGEQKGVSPEFTTQLIKTLFGSRGVAP